MATTATKRPTVREINQALREGINGSNQRVYRRPARTDGTLGDPQRITGAKTDKGAFKVKQTCGWVVVRDGDEVYITRN